MSYTDSAQVDTEARRYLRHHHLLDAARQRAYHYLNQTWLYMTRSLNRELRAQDQLMKRTWVELMSTQEGEYIGVNWHSISSHGVYTITMADVRYDPDLNGEHVVFKISADRVAARQELQQRLSADKVLALYPSELDLAAHLLRYNIEAECVVSLCFPQTAFTLQGLSWYCVSGRGAITAA